MTDNGFTCIEETPEIYNTIYTLDLLDGDNEIDTELIAGLYPRGKLSALCAEGGIGKTMVLVASSLAITSGKAFLPTVLPNSGRKVLLIDTEGRAREFNRRVRKFGGITANYCTAKHPLKICVFSSKEDRQEIERVLRTASIDLVIVDSFAGFSNVDENTNAVLPALQWLSGLALEHNVAIVFTQLVNKSEIKSKITTKAIRGFSGISQWCEMIWALDKDSKAPNARRLYQIKNNITKEDNTVYLFNIEDTCVQFADSLNTLNVKYPNRYKIIENNPKLSNKAIAQLIQQEEPNTKLGSLEMWLSRNRSKVN
jgi:RecA-family ATPase